MKRKNILKKDFLEVFETYLDKAGALLDEYNVPKELINKIALLDVGIKAEITDFTIDSDNLIELMEGDESLREDIIYDIETWATKDNWEMLADRIEVYGGFGTIKLGSLPEEMKFAEFKEQLAENPYQLKIG